MVCSSPLENSYHTVPRGIIGAFHVTGQGHFITIKTVLLCYYSIYYHLLRRMARVENN